MTTLPHDSILGCLLGTAVGDALALPMERMSRHQVRRFIGQQELGHRLVFGRGMFSDDTEHTLMVAIAWLRNPENPSAFQRSLAWSLLWWLAALPAGVGMATLKAVTRLWLGFPTTRSGVRSAGNGAAMRSAILGVLLADKPEQRRSFVQASCRLTHVDPRAEEAALLVAEAAALAVHRQDVATILKTLRPWITSSEMETRFSQLETALQSDLSVLDYAVEIGCDYGVSGFAPNTVAVALYAWLRHRGDFAEMITQIIRCGGDTDTVAAIAGGISGVEVGEAGIPEKWIRHVSDWPRSIAYVHRVAGALSQRVAGETPTIPRLCWPFVLPRNLIFLLIILAHGFKRLPSTLTPQSR